MTSTASPFTPLQPLALEIASLLKSHHSTLSLAETATGGLLSSTLLSIPGSSTFYRSGVVLYTLQSRLIYAGWTQAHIDAYHGPTEDIVRGIADHVRGQLGATYALAESGTAGPTGGKGRNRTPGYVALAVASPRKTYTREVETGLGGDREGNMVAFGKAALEFLRDVILEEEKEGEEGEARL